MSNAKRRKTAKGGKHGLRVAKLEDDTAEAHTELAKACTADLRERARSYARTLAEDMKTAAEKGTAFSVAEQDAVLDSLLQAADACPRVTLTATSHF